MASHSSIRLLAPQRHEWVDRLDDEQRDTVARCNAGESFIVEGGPGSGKTTAMLACIFERYRHTTSLDSMAILTASRSQAQRLRTQIVDHLNCSQSGMQITTVHGWAQHLLRHANADMSLLTAPDQEMILRQLLEKSTVRWPSELTEAISTPQCAHQLRSTLATVRQWGWDPEDLIEAGVIHKRAEWEAAGEFFNEYLDVLDAQQLIDYNELIVRARLALTEEDISRRIVNQTSVIFCDEYAEYDAGMIDLLAQCHHAGIQICAFADSDTSIYHFRGADRRAVSDFERLFTSSAQVSHLRLSTPHRYRGSLAGVIDSFERTIPIATDLRGYQDHRRKADHSDDPDRVKAIASEDIDDQFDTIATYLHRWHRQGIPWEKMAIITALGSGHSAQIASQISKRAIPVISRDQQRALGEQIAVRHLLRILIIALDIVQKRHTDWSIVIDAFTSPISTISYRDLRFYQRLLVNKAHQAGRSYRRSEQLLADEILVGDLSVGDERCQPISDLRSLIETVVAMIENGDNPASILWTIWTASTWPQQLRTLALSGGDQAPAANRDLDAVIALFDRAERHIDSQGIAAIQNFCDQILGQRIAADTQRESTPWHLGVFVGTIYQAKGLEWDAVVMVGLEEGHMPHIQMKTPLIGVEDLTREGQIVHVDLRTRIADERRRFLCAISRARSHLLLSCVRGRADDPVARPSDFVTDASLTWEEDSPSQMNLDDLIAHLRRIGIDSSSSAALRYAAAQQLAWIASQRDDRNRLIAPAANPQQWWSARGYTQRDDASWTRPPIYLTGSHTESLLRCPRQWVLSRKAGGNVPTSQAMTIGTLIHSIVQEATMKKFSLTQMRQCLDDAWKNLTWSSEWESKAAYGVAESALSSFDLWNRHEEHSRVIAVEYPFSYTVNIQGIDICVMGTVDRLEVTSEGAVRVIDFKTSKTAPSKEKVSQMDQLGIYQLAVREGVFHSLTDSTILAPAEAVYLCKVKANGEPTVREQPSLDPGEQTWVHEHLYQAARYIVDKNFCAIANEYCSSCPFIHDCPAQEGR